MEHQMELARALPPLQDDIAPFDEEAELTEDLSA